MSAADYQRLEVIGKGSFGSVYRGYEKQLITKFKLS